MLNEWELFSGKSRARKVDPRASVAWTVLGVLFLVLVTLAIVGLNSLLNA